MQKTEQSNWTGEIFVRFVVGVTETLALGLIVLTHRTFGERYLSVGRMLVGLFVVWGLTFWASLVGDGRSALVAWCWWPVMLAALVYHRWAIWRRNQEGVRIHSRYEGEPLPIWGLIPLDEEKLKLFVQPAAVVILAGVAVAAGAELLGAWFAVQGTFLFLGRLLEHKRMRYKLLDIIDSQIEAESLQAQLRGDSSVGEELRCPVRRMPVVELPRPEQAEALKKLDPGLAALLSESKAPEVAV